MSVQTPMTDVLIVTGGLTPQVVTATVYALSLAYKKHGPQSFLPMRIICVVTGNVAERFGSHLENALSRLAEDVGLSVTWGPLIIAVPKTASGDHLADVRTDDDAVLFGDFISELVRNETSDPQSRVYLSLAGGRKTMSFHGGAAMGLWARPQDLLPPVKNRAFLAA